MKFPALLFPLFCALVVSVSAASAPVDWPAFLGRHDFRWQTLPTRWEESAFIGNGNLGATIHLQEQKLSWEINRTDLYVRGSRIPAGRLSLETAGAVTGGDLRLDLWNAEAGGTLTTDRGEVRWRSIALRQPGLILIEVIGSGGESAPAVIWHPALARPARTTYNQAHPLRKNAPREEYGPDDLHPSAQVAAADDGFTATQVYLKAGASAVVARGRTSGPGRRIYCIALEHAASVDTAVSKAEAAIEAARKIPVETLFATHRAWWHGYYPQSLVSLPDAPGVEAFYWRQIYKLGSAMRPDGPILDLLGPWFRTTRWPRIWWNLNLQLTYHPLASSNRLELAESLYRNLDRHREKLIDNVVPARPRRDAAAISRATGQELRGVVQLDRADDNHAAREAGNLPWIAYLYWEFYRSQMDDALLRDRVFPLLSLAIGHYLTHVETDAAGVIHLKPTYSPEFALVSDANYDLALFRRGLQALIAACERLALDDPRLPLWRETLARLAPFPVDDTGLMIGRDRPLDVAHRHYSHLLAIYPLHLLDLDDPRERALAERSVDHWLALDGGYRTGFSHTGAASLQAALGRGDLAFEQLNRLLALKSGDGRGVQLHPNTLYTEGGGPVIETPLSVVSVVNEMLLQSHGGVLRVFPAAPSAWKDATFADLRAEGAFLVGAERRDGLVRRVEIRSLAGEPCRLRVPGWTAEKVRVVRHEGQAIPPRLTALPGGDLQIDLGKNARVVLEP